MKTYEVLKPITLAPGLATDKNGEAMGAQIVSTGIINMDENHSATKSLLENGCIKEKGMAKAADPVPTERTAGRGKR